MINSPSFLLTLTLALFAAGCSSGSSLDTAATDPNAWVGTITFVLDRSVPVLRSYDLAGNHLLDMERGGIVLPMVAGDDGTLYMPVDRSGPVASGLMPIAPDGTVLIVERRAEAVPVTDEERAWQEGLTSLGMKQLQPDWEWNANPIPASKPFFDRFYTDPDGRYLGQVEIPAIKRVNVPSIRGNTFVQAVEDDAGTIMVKRYRLMLPGEEGL